MIVESNRSGLSIGKSSRFDEYEAVLETVTMARENCESPCFGLVFTTDQYDPNLIAKAFNEILPHVPWAGCTSAGVFANNALLTQGVVLGLVSGSSLKVGVGVAPLTSSNSREAGAEAVIRAFGELGVSTPELSRTLIVFSDSKVGNVSEVIRGAAQEAGTLNVWAGGGVGNVVQDANTAQFAQGQAYAEHVIVIAIDSLQPIVTGIGHGWRPYGPPTMVTRSLGNITYELEYEEAFEVYRQTAASRGETVTIEKFSQFAITHPLGIPQADGNYVIRDPISVGRDGSLQFIAEVPDGCLVRVMEGNPFALLKAAEYAAESAKKSSHDNLSGAFVFDCISRFLVLDQNYEKELETFRHALGETIPFIGCLTLGEVGSFGKGVPQFHNKTAVVMALHG